MDGRPAHHPSKRRVFLLFLPVQQRFYAMYDATSNVTSVAEFPCEGTRHIVMLNLYADADVSIVCSAGEPLREG